MYNVIRLSNALLEKLIILTTNNDFVENYNNFFIDKFIITIKQLY